VLQITSSAVESVDAFGVDGLRQLAGELGILRWNEPPDRGLLDSLLNGTPQRVYTGCLPVRYGPVEGDADAVWIEWSLVGPRTHQGMLEAVGDQFVTALRINRVAKVARADRSNRVVQVLTNAPAVRYPAREEIPAPVPTDVIALSSHRVGSGASLQWRDDRWKIVLGEGDR